MNQILVFLVGSLLVLTSLNTQAEILVYKVNAKTIKGTEINDGVSTAWGSSSYPLTIYFILNLDGIDATVQETFNFSGNEYVPGTLTIDPKNKICVKEVDETDPFLANEIDRTVYGRARKGGTVSFNVLYMQRDAANDSGTHDTGVATATGKASLLDIGGGITGYYAKSLNFIITRLDGSFDGSRGDYQDGRQWKNATVPLILDLDLTIYANNHSLGKNEIMDYICDLPANATYPILITHSNSSGDIGYQRE